MPWTYHQRSGELFYDGHLVAVGYSGRGAAKNDPAAQDRKAEGPIPRGRYTVRGPPFCGGHMGRDVLSLEPDEGNEMHGRSGFCAHGDSLESPGSASRGCIILGRAARLAIWSSGDLRLEVVE